ncbi:hypothetical protein HAX54_017720 [Datura stramonium]|uniref:F-box domain-containing protein n=1 Tax=Datura stramonium TaxID=4076 RepID=A0ABS8S318_DATST|nr:hypothetical protein [Datura stramonium]
MPKVTCKDLLRLSCCPLRVTVTQAERSGFNAESQLSNNVSGTSTEEHEESDEQLTLFRVPNEILEQILSRLNLKENIRASAVCKQWLAASISVRVANKPPWLMFFPKVGDLVEFYDPSVRQALVEL